MADTTSPSHEADNLASCSAAALRALEERARSALATSREQVSLLESEITNQIEAIASTLAKEQADADTEQEAANAELTRKLAELEAEQKVARDDWAMQLADFERKLREQQAAWNSQRDEDAETRRGLESDLEALQQKFQLALEDVQRYRGRAAELEQELTRRPEATESDSAELVALRAERDALAERLEQVEKQSVGHLDANIEQQMADLQRRFELAVEDVRELKTKNAQLEAQLAAGASQSARVSSDGGGMDWESQKRRLLASLEDEGEVEDDPERQEERVRIQGTIEMTDAVVAEKDHEIAELKAQLEQGVGVAASDDAYDEKIAELIDADEVIADHREKIAKLERDMEATLRAAELELSLERAKIARERVELDELRAELESLRNELGPNAQPAPGAPRRRWLSKLGLSGDE